MPRVKANPDELLVLELRITPPDGHPITEWEVSDQNFKQVIAAQEGGTETVRLHYHAYVECKRSKTWLTKWIYSIARVPLGPDGKPTGPKGNSVFFTGKPHDNTIGYVIKHGNIVVRHGCSETFITEWIAKSEQYRKDHAAAKKRKQRIEKSFTQQVRESIVAMLESSPELRNPSKVLDCILHEYHQAHKVFPNRSTVENLIATLLYPYEGHMISAYYLKSFNSCY